jgi:hypothetical protein
MSIRPAKRGLFHARIHHSRIANIPGAAMQSRLGSFVEAWANIAIGFSISFLANLAVLPAFGYPVTVSDAFGIGLIFTAVSLARSYVIRRWFNGLAIFRSKQ